MSLIEANLFPQAAAMLHDGKELTDKMKAERKAIFLEGLIRFLDIYAQTEIGEGIQIDIMKTALYVNSARFENDDLYEITEVECVYRLLEALTIAGLPVWRFLKLTEYQSGLFESGYNELLVSAKMKAADERPCYGCIWYKERETFLGMLRECHKPETEWRIPRREAHDPDAIKHCKWLTTLDVIPEALNAELRGDDFLSVRRKREFLTRIEPAREQFKKKMLDDPFRIPKDLSDDEKFSLDKTYDVWEDFALVWKNEKSYSERQFELRKAMYMEGMIRFFETYAKCEMGSRYISDIKNIALYVDGLYEPDLKFIKEFEDVYYDLENKIIDGFKVEKFIKFDEEG